ncbi:MAG: hypothetical protein QXO71_05320 [Candidatus Jordarchaeaceae archaeon]
MEVENFNEHKKQLQIPREGEIVNYNEDILGALEKLNRGETVFVCPRKLSILMRRYGRAACVRTIRWRGKSIFRIDPINES